MHSRIALTVACIAGAYWAVCAGGYGGDAAAPAGKPGAVLAWTTDFEAAKQTAAREGKDLFIDFTGSDWCGWCMRLKSEVFDQPEFAREASKHFVFVEIDFPRRKQQAPEKRAANQKLARRFGIRGFPTIILADAQGRSYARTGYKPGGARAYLKHLTELQAVRIERDKNLAKAAKAQGIEKARLLDAALRPVMRNAAFVGYDKEVREILAADPDNKGGFKVKYYPLTLWPRMQAPGADIPALTKELDAFIKQYAPTAKGEAAQELLFARSFCAYRTGDKPAAVKFLQAAKAAAPGTSRAQAISKMLAQMQGQAGAGTREK